MEPEGADQPPRTGIADLADAAFGLAADANRRVASAARWAMDHTPVGPVTEALADAAQPLAERGRRDREAATEATSAFVSELATGIATEIMRVLDVDDLIRRVDVDAVVKRVDVNDVIRRVDVDEIVRRIDVDEIVRRTEVGSLIVQSTGGVAVEMLDVVRSQAVGLDRFVQGIVNRILRRKPGDLPTGPPRLVRAEADVP